VRCMCDVCGEVLIATSRQFRRSRGEKSIRLGLVALTVGPVHMRMRASREQARNFSLTGRNSFVLKNSELVLDTKYNLSKDGHAETCPTASQHGLQISTQKCLFIPGFGLVIGSTSVSR